MILRTLLTPRPGRGAGWAALASVWIIALFSAEYWHDFLGLSDYLAASQQMVFADGQWWRLLTSMLIHADIRHLVGNAVPLALLVWLVYGYFGARIYPLATTIVGIAITAITLLTYSPQTRLVGISGLVYVLAGFWLTSFFLIERRLSVGQRLLRCAGFSLVMLLPSAVEPSVSYRVHAIGAVAGVAMGLVHFWIRRDWIRSAEIHGPDPYEDDLIPAIDEDDPEDPPSPISHTIH